MAEKRQIIISSFLENSPEAWQIMRAVENAVDFFVYTKGMRNAKWRCESPWFQLVGDKEGKHYVIQVNACMVERGKTPKKWHVAVLGWESSSPKFIVRALIPVALRPGRHTVLYINEEKTRTRLMRALEAVYQKVQTPAASSLSNFDKPVVIDV